MGKRRVTFVVDDNLRQEQGCGPFLSAHAKWPYNYGWAGVTVESDEDIPNPTRRYLVTITPKKVKEEPGVTAAEVREALQRQLISSHWDITVEEVTDP